MQETANVRTNLPATLSVLLGQWKSSLFGLKAAALPFDCEYPILMGPAMPAGVFLRSDTLHQVCSWAWADLGGILLPFEL